MTNGLQNYDPNELARYGQEVNRVAAKHVFADYQSRKAANTLRNQENALHLFAGYLHDAKWPRIGDFFNDPEAWEGISWGLVQGFLHWLLNEGYATATANGMLYTVKVYADLAALAGIIPSEEITMIRGVRALRANEAGRVDEKREVKRIGSKKEFATLLTPEQVAFLKTPQSDKPVALRDALLMSVLLDHGLRSSEAAALDKSNFEGKYLNFRRPKVAGSKYEFAHHEMTPDVRRAWKRWKPYLAGDAVFVGTADYGRQITDNRMTRDNLSHRVAFLGTHEKLGLETALSAHDCRHTLATWLSRKHADVQELMDVFGWSNPGTAVGYVAAAKVGNEVYWRLGMMKDEE